LGALNRAAFTQPVAAITGTGDPWQPEQRPRRAVDSDRTGCGTYFRRDRTGCFASGRNRLHRRADQAACGDPQQRWHRARR
jgi:hypothetical protein